MILNEGLNKIVEQTAESLLTGRAGTNNTAVTMADGGVVTSVADTNQTLQVETADKIIKTTFTIPTMTATGTTFCEEGEEFDTGESLSRVVHTNITKQASTEIRYIKTFFYNQAP